MKLHRPRFGQPTSASPWTRPPQPPAGYPLRDRLSDMIHGWLDGRRGIPPLRPSPDRPVNGRAVPAAEGRMKELPKPHDTAPAAPAASPPQKPWTPRVEVLSQQARALIEDEQIRCSEDRAIFLRELAEFRTRRDALSEEVLETEKKLADARSPLSSQERENRRIAEKDPGKRPDSLVRARRQAAWDRRLVHTEREYQAVVMELAEATRNVQLREELIEEREAVARAAARRHHEFAMRRIATYLQQLVRTHRHRAELSQLLITHPVGPDLPEWTKDPEPGRPEAGHRRGNGSQLAPGDRFLESEVSGA